MENPSKNGCSGFRRVGVLDEGCGIGGVNFLEGKRERESFTFHRRKMSMEEALCRCDIYFDGGAGIAGWNDASETLNVTLELVRRAYSEQQKKQLLGGNLLQVGRSPARGTRTTKVNRIWPSRRPSR